MVRARSRSFIPASLNSNIFFDGKNYDAVLAALPSELRAAYRDGSSQGRGRRISWRGPQCERCDREIIIEGFRLYFGLQFVP